MWKGRKTPTQQQSLEYMTKRRLTVHSHTIGEWGSFGQSPTSIALLSGCLLAFEGYKKKTTETVL